MRGVWQKKHSGAAMLLLIDLSMALLLPLNALPPAVLGARLSTAAPRRLGCVVAMRDAASEAACEVVPPARYARRSVLLGATLLALPASGFARTPGSVDVRESVDQIRDAAAALRKLRQVPPPTHARTCHTCGTRTGATHPSTTHLLWQVPPIHPPTHLLDPGLLPVRTRTYASYSLLTTCYGRSGRATL